MLYVDLSLTDGASFEIPNEHEDRAIYVATGRIALDDAEFSPGNMIVLERNAPANIRALEESRLLLLGGAPLEGRRYIWWNFVSSSRERIEQAKRDWVEERFAKVPGETEFIPVPSEETHPPPL